jgi:hypothetical protein
MSSATHRCEKCSQPLASATAVCERCENEIATYEIATYSTLEQLMSRPTAPAPLNEGHHVCPACTKRFKFLVSMDWPKQQKWYLPQLAKACCPHCEVPLRSKHRLRLGIMLLVLAVVKVTALFIPRLLTFPLITLLVSLFVLVVVYHVYVARREARDETAFVCDR